MRQSLRTEHAGICSRTRSMSACRCWMGADARLFLTHPPPIAAGRVREPVVHTAARDGLFVLAHSVVDPPLGDFERPGWAQKLLPLAPDRAATTRTTNCESHDDPG